MNPSELKETMQLGIQTPFWKEIVKHLEERVNMYEEKILDGEDLTPDEEKKLKRSRAVYKYVISLPDILIRISTPGESAGEKDFDPYEK